MPQLLIPLLGMISSAPVQALILVDGGAPRATIAKRPGAGPPLEVRRLQPTSVRGVHAVGWLRRLREAVAGGERKGDW